MAARRTPEQGPLEDGQRIVLTPLPAGQRTQPAELLVLAGSVPTAPEYVAGPTSAPALPAGLRGSAGGSNAIGTAERDTLPDSEERDCLRLAAGGHYTGGAGN